MNALFNSDQVYQLDRAAIEFDRIPGAELMRRAASVVWREIDQRWGGLQHIVVVAGAGNNGGDGFALACIARAQGIGVSLFMLGDPDHQSAASAIYRDQWVEGGGEIQQWPGFCPPADLIVDGLLGIGLSKPLNAAWVDLIEQLNKHPAPKASIDIPSGLDANRGIALPVAVRASLTVSFIGRKVGCYLADGPDHCGQRVFDSLGVSRAVYARHDPLCHVIDAATVKLPARRKLNSHKNDFGHVLVVGGDRSMSGAVRLAARAALRAGAGLVSACVHPENYALVAQSDAEIMVYDWSQLRQMLTRASVVVVGPGLGRSEAAAGLLEILACCRLPMVVDADALEAGFLDRVASDATVITPHPGEAGRILELPTVDVQQDRIKALQQITRRWPATCVLKGAGSLVGQQRALPRLCSDGHPGMATAGSGDVLAGLIGGLLAQHMEPLEAVSCGVYLHARAADSWVLTRAGECLVAGDLLTELGSVWHALRQVQARRRDA